MRAGLEGRSRAVEIGIGLGHQSKGLTMKRSLLFTFLSLVGISFAAAHAAVAQDCAVPETGLLEMAATDFAKANPPPGCPFNTRCPRAEDKCSAEVPEWREIKPGHWVACHFAE